MNEGSVQQAWNQLESTLFCGRCKAVRFLILDARGAKNINSAAPVHSHLTTSGDFWYAVHCDYFRRAIDQPDSLRRCGAFQKRPGQE